MVVTTAMVAIAKSTAARHARGSRTHRNVGTTWEH
jgi:hypothetical protein